MNKVATVSKTVMDSSYVVEVEHPAMGTMTINFYRPGKNKKQVQQEADYAEAWLTRTLMATVRSMRNYRRDGQRKGGGDDVKGS